jgi:sarcosine oxidase
MESYDVAVVGLGGMGSAALANLARRGVRAIGIEQFTRGHALGASSGRSRLIRKAYFEHPSYVPLLLRAYEAWREVEAATNQRIFYETGLLMAGPPESVVLQGALRAARTYDLPIEELDAAQIVARFPMMHPAPGEVGVYEPDAGFVVPEVSFEAHMRIAQAHGAAARFDTTVLDWRRADGMIRLRLAGGETIDASRVVACAGPWWATHADGAMPIRLQRNVMHWFTPASDAFTLGRCPSFLIERAGAPERLYGFPDHGYGVKAAFHGYGDALAAPEQLDRSIRPGDVTVVQAALDAWMPGAAAAWNAGKACMYAYSPDEHFIVGLHPGDPQIVLAGGFSGHGFKFAAVIGEVLADLALEGGTSFDIAFLSPARFATA